jgi:hypothetical protein
MSTGNFYNKNASRIFAFEVEDDFDYEDTVGNILASLLDRDFSEETGYENGLRSFTGRYIASKCISKSFCGLSVDVTIKAICRSGYYSGANIDWELGYQFEETSEEKPEASDIAEILERYYGVGAGMATIQGRNALRFIERAETQLVEELEAVLAEFTEPLVVVGRFSNGETLYERADNCRAVLKAAVNG